MIMSNRREYPTDGGPLFPASQFRKVLRVGELEDSEIIEITYPGISIRYAFAGLFGLVYLARGITGYAEVAIRAVDQADALLAALRILEQEDDD